MSPKCTDREGREDATQELGKFEMSLEKRRLKYYMVNITPCLTFFQMYEYAFPRCPKLPFPSEAKREAIDMIMI